jgi:hypothetical protein
MPSFMKYGFNVFQLQHTNTDNFLGCTESTKIRPQIFRAIVRSQNISSEYLQELKPVSVVSVLQAGCFFGSLIAYWAADKFGRKVRIPVMLSRRNADLNIAVFDGCVCYCNCWHYSPDRFKWTRVKSPLMKL